MKIHCVIEWTIEFKTVLKSLFYAMIMSIFFKMLCTIWDAYTKVYSIMTVNLLLTLRKSFMLSSIINHFSTTLSFDLFSWVLWPLLMQEYHFNTHLMQKRSTNPNYENVSMILKHYFQTWHSEQIFPVVWLQNLVLIKCIEFTKNTFIN